MAELTGQNRRFLFLQGPHGPFFSRLADSLLKTGASAWRVGFNAGDEHFWRDRASYITFDAPQSEWQDTFRRLIAEKRITDLVLYGDTRVIHAQAMEAARDAGLTIHVFEEGYLRPYWVTYERDGSNGNSSLMTTRIADMQAALSRTEHDVPEPPAHWGEMREHVFYGAVYHGHVMLGRRRYRAFKPHRSLSVQQEFRLYLKRLMLMPFIWADRWISTRRIERGGFPYHLALLQLEHDASFRDHGPFQTMQDFLETLVQAFADGAPIHHHLVVKGHPLDDGRAPIRRALMRLARQHRIQDRVHFLPGGKLARLLDHARSAVTVNSTSGQQALWRGLPLKAFGAAVYGKPELVSPQPLASFFGEPQRPDLVAYRTFRLFLLETSQVAGGYYSTAGRRQLLRQAVDLMLAAHHPYQTLLSDTAAHRQHIRSAT